MRIALNGKKINRSIQFRMSKSITHDLAETVPMAPMTAKKNKNRQNGNPLWNRCVDIGCEYLVWIKAPRLFTQFRLKLETCNGFYSNKIAPIVFQARLKINHVRNCLSNFSRNEWKLVCKCVHYYAVYRT